MHEYSKVYRNYYATIKKCTDSSRKYMSIPAPTNAHFHASLLFTKLCTCSVSILNLSPAPEMLGKDAHWDFGSVASLTRNIIECYLVFYYMCIEKCTKEECEARWRLMNLHDHISRTKLFDSMGEDTNNEEANKIKEEVLLALNNNSWFQDLNKKQKIHFAKGNTAFFKSKDEIVVSCGREVSDFRTIYRFLSNNTHSFPMGFYRMASGNRGRGLESTTEVKYTGLCLEWAADYLNNANEEFVDLFENGR